MGQNSSSITDIVDPISMALSFGPRESEEDKKKRIAKSKRRASYYTTINKSVQTEIHINSTNIVPNPSTPIREININSPNNIITDFSKINNIQSRQRSLTSPSVIYK